jgi:hypothetical protein
MHEGRGVRGEGRGVEEGFFAVENRRVEMAIVLFALNSPLSPRPCCK